MEKHRIALLVIVDSDGVDALDAANRARFAVGVEQDDCAISRDLGNGILVHAHVVRSMVALTKPQ